MKLSQHIFMDYAGMHDKNSTCNGNKLTFCFGRNGFTKALSWNFERMNIMLGTKYILFLQLECRFYNYTEMCMTASHNKDVNIKQN